MLHGIVTVTHVTFVIVTPSFFFSKVQNKKKKRKKEKKREKDQKENKRNLNNRKEVEKKQVHYS